MDLNPFSWSTRESICAKVKKGIITNRFWGIESIQLKGTRVAEADNIAICAIKEKKNLILCLCVFLCVLRTKQPKRKGRRGLEKWGAGRGGLKTKLDLFEGLNCKTPATENGECLPVTTTTVCWAEKLKLRLKLCGADLALVNFDLQRERMELMSIFCLYFTRCSVWGKTEENIQSHPSV